MPSMNIVRCLPGHADTLTRIAHASKRHWGYPERWIEEWREALTVLPQLILDHPVYAAEYDGQLGGFFALIRAGRRMELEHMWVDPTYIGTGMGRALFDHATQVAQRADVRVIDISSDPNAEGFYRRMGARVVGQVPAHVDGQSRFLPRLEYSVPTPVAS